MAKPSKKSRDMYQWFLDIFECKELRYLPDNVLKEVLANNTAVYEEYIKEYPDLSEDSLREFFETYFADRKFLNQDFTPDSLAFLIAELIGPQPETVEEAAGIGSLIIPQWNMNHDIKVYARELSAVTIPFLLFNLALRNMQGVVIHGDTLTLETFAVYVLNKGENFSVVTKINFEEEVKRTDPLILMKSLLNYYPERFKYERQSKSDPEQIGFFDQQPKTKA